MSIHHNDVYNGTLFVVTANSTDYVHDLDFENKLKMVETFLHPTSFVLADVYGRGVTYFSKSM